MDVGAKEDKRLEELRGLIGDLTNALQMQIATDKGTKRKRSENDADAAKMEALQQEFEKKLNLLRDRASDLFALTPNKPDAEHEKRIQQQISALEDTEIINLNIGGTSFATSKASLNREPNSMLAVMFSGRHMLPKTDSGEYFIDRDPTHFTYIMQYLRTGVVASVPESADEREEIFQESEFYGLVGLSEHLQGKIARESELGGENLRAREDENKVRQMFLSPMTPTSKQQISGFLINVFAELDSFEYNKDNGIHQPSLPLLMEWERNEKMEAIALEKDKSSIEPKNIEEFKTTFYNRFAPTLKELDWSNIFVAGGSVLGSLLGKKVPRAAFNASDVDLFIHGLDAKATEKKIEHIYDVISRSCLGPKSKKSYRRRRYKDEEDENPNSEGESYEESEEEESEDEAAKEKEKGKKRVTRRTVMMVRTKRTVTFVTGYPRKHVQLVLRLYQSPAEVLLGFDLDCVSVGFDGTNVFCLPRCRRALNFLYNIADPSRQTYRTSSYEYRLWKYSKRGFAVAVPGFRRSHVDGRIYISQYKDLHGFAKLLFLERRDYQKRVLQTERIYRDWFEDNGYKLEADAMLDTDEAYSITDMDVLEHVKDYNRGVLLPFTPISHIESIESRLQALSNEPYYFIYDSDVKEILDYTELMIPRKIEFIGSLAQYIQSLPDVEDDWFHQSFKQ